MSEIRHKNIFLTGFMGTGKSSVGKRLAVLIGYDFVDLDALIEAECGLPISQIFEREGEPAFRALEARMVERASNWNRCVVATGGGAILDARNLEMLRRNGVVIALTSDPETIAARVGETEDRPLLRSADRLARIRTLLKERAPAYSKADMIVNTSADTLDEAARHILEFLERPAGVNFSAPQHETAALPPATGPQPLETVRVELGSRAYDVHVGVDLLTRAGDLARPLRLGRHLGLITHPALNQAYGDTVKASLEAVGHEVTTLEVAAGEESKSLQQAAALCRELIRSGLDRGSAVVGLGGGVIGDLAGFVSGILYRGIPFINIPTTLLSQVDSSVGGKTGVNVAEGKNLVGVFHQPSLVLADIRTLRSLPEREFRSGLGEVVKYGMISDRALFELLEQEAEKALERDADLLRHIVSVSCAIKARVVAADERETGLRAILNFGHTIGHAVEAALGYGAVTHGEAVAMGMVVAAELSVARGMCAEGDARRLKKLLQRFGLLSAPLPEYEALEPYILRDKKARSGTLQFVAVRGAGDVELIVLREFEGLRRAVRAARHSLR